MRIYKLRANHIENPLGFNMNNLSLSWIVDDDKSSFAEAARVEIAEDESFGKIISDSGRSNEIDSLCYAPDIELSERKRYYWRVTVWGNKGNSCISETAWFETGKMNEEWSADWITPDMPSDIHPFLSRSFSLNNDVISARMYICGLGLYELEINGERVGDEYLTPGINAYDYWLQYQTYDVTDYLKRGRNYIGVILGNGMYKGRFGYDGYHSELYGDRFAMICELMVRFKDGSSLIIKSDEDFKCIESPVEFSGIYDGEVYNAQKKLCGLSYRSAEEAEWKNTKKINLDKTKLTERLSVPVKIKENIKPVRLIKTPKGEMVLDMGQNMAGWIKFKDNATKGTHLKLQYGEVLQDGCFYNENLRTAKAEFVYISDGKGNEIQPHFTYYGFRYVKLSGFDNIDIDDFMGCCLYSDIDITGKITTSNALVNRLFKNTQWSQKDNFIDVPTDCPQRDERMGWTGDAQIFSAAASYNMYTPAFYRKYMYDLYEEQKRRGGSVPFVAPSIKPDNAEGFVNGDGSTVWGDAATIIPWTVYLQYGDKLLLESQFDSMKSWVDYLRKSDEDSGNTRLIKTGFQFGDWLSLDGDNDVYGGTDCYYIASSYYCYSAEIVAKAARVLGKIDLEKEYKKLSYEIKQAVQNEYFFRDGRCRINTQTALILALYMNLVPEEAREDIISELKIKLKENNMHLSTGFVGTPYFCIVLSENDADDYAYTLLFNEDYPGWLYEVKLGATTIWERWNSILPDGAISGTGMNSLNHYAYGSIAEWMYKYMCGIKCDENMPGFRKIIFEPKPDRRLKYVQAEYMSPCGKIECGWNITEEGRLTIRVTVPFGTAARIILPKADVQDVRINNEQFMQTKFKYTVEGRNICCSLEKGTYVFEYNPVKNYTLKA